MVTPHIVCVQCGAPRRATEPTCHRCGDTRSVENHPSYRPASEDRPGYLAGYKDGLAKGMEMTAACLRLILEETKQ